MAERYRCSLTLGVGLDVDHAAVVVLEVVNAPPRECLRVLALVVKTPSGSGAGRRRRGAICGGRGQGKGGCASVEDMGWVRTEAELEPALVDVVRPGRRATLNQLQSGVGWGAEERRGAAHRARMPASPGPPKEGFGTSRPLALRLSSAQVSSELIYT